MRNNESAHIHHALAVSVNHLVPVSHTLTLHQGEVHAPCAVHHNIQLAELANAAVYGRLALHVIADIARGGQGVGAGIGPSDFGQRECGNDLF